MDFPDLQENLWERFSQDPTFSSQQLFPSLNDLEYVKSTIETISDEMGVRYHERDAVENMVRFGLEEVYKNKVLREEFRLRGGCEVWESPEPRARGTFDGGNHAGNDD